MKANDEFLPNFDICFYYWQIDERWTNLIWVSWTVTIIIICFQMKDFYIYVKIIDIL